MKIIQKLHSIDESRRNKLIALVTEPILTINFNDFNGNLQISLGTLENSTENHEKIRYFHLK